MSVALGVSDPWPASFFRTLGQEMTVARRNRLLAMIDEARRLSDRVTSYFKDLPPSELDRPFGQWTPEYDEAVGRGVRAADAVRRIEARLLGKGPWEPLTIPDRGALEIWWESVMTTWRIYDRWTYGPEKRIVAGLLVVFGGVLCTQI